MSSPQNIRIEEVSQEAAGAIFARLCAMSPLPKSAEDVAETIVRLGDGRVTMFVHGDNGYALYVQRPRYAPFLRLNIPEIQDVNVHPDHRGQGIATALIAACEKRAREDGHATIGLGVGLDARYGPAQRLYGKLGYLPDGAGLVYDAEPVAFGAARPNDDDLCLMMIKEL